MNFFWIVLEIISAFLLDYSGVGICFLCLYVKLCLFMDIMFPRAMIQTFSMQIIINNNVCE